MQLSQNTIELLDELRNVFNEFVDNLIFDLNSEKEQGFEEEEFSMKDAPIA